MQNGKKLYFSILQKELAAHDHEYLIDNSKEVFVKKGSMIYSCDTTPSGIVVVRKGKVKLFFSSSSKARIFDLGLPDDLLGYRELISGRCYKHSAEALESTELLLIPKKVFIELLPRYPGLLEVVLQDLCLEYEKSVNAVCLQSFYTVMQRLALILLNLDGVYGTRINITRENLAALIGSARETIFRHLIELEKDGYVKINGREIKVLDRESLEALCY